MSETDIDNDELDKLRPAVRNRILSAEFHEAEAQRWKEEAGETLAELLRVRTENTRLKEALEHAEAFLTTWEGRSYVHMSDVLRIVRAALSPAEAE